MENYTTMPEPDNETQQAIAHFSGKLEAVKASLVAPSTRLSGKEFSPMILRRYSSPVLHWIAIIADANLDDLDMIDRSYWQNFPEAPTIQQFRNFAGGLTETIVKTYQGIEGCAVIISADKMLISSLHGDFMNHGQCRLELYQLLNLSTQI